MTQDWDSLYPVNLSEYGPTYLVENPESGLPIEGVFTGANPYRTCENKENWITAEFDREVTFTAIGIRFDPNNDNPTYDLNWVTVYAWDGAQWHQRFKTRLWRNPGKWNYYDVPETTANKLGFVIYNGTSGTCVAIGGIRLIHNV